MPTDKVSSIIGRMYIENPETGERTELNGIPTLTMTTDDTSEFEPNAFPAEYSFSMDISNISDKVKDMLFGKKLVCTGILEEISNKLFKEIPDIKSILNIDLIQNRIHKKKRINRKWANRYGYTMTVDYE